MLVINDRILRFIRYKLEAQFKKLWKSLNFKKAALIILAGELKKQEKIPPFRELDEKWGWKKWAQLIDS